jgi:phage-related tail fiber protein
MAIPKFLTGLTANNKRIQAVADPTAATDAATKQYVDNVAAGLNWKANVRAISTANVVIASALINGLSMDGVTLATGDRVLLKDQTTASENGIYIVAASGAASRATDADTSAEVRNMIVRAESGTVNGDTMWQLTTDNPTLGSTSLVFTKFTGGGTTYTAGAGLTESPAGTFNVGQGTGITVNADDVQINTAVVVRKFAAAAVATTNPQTFAHGLGTADVEVAIYESGSLVFPDVTVDATNVTVDWGGAPTAAQYRVLAQG